VHDGSDEVVAGFPVEGGGKGSASRFFYCTKASVKDREEGLAHLPDGILAYSNGAQAAVNGGSDEYTGGSQDIGLNKVKKRKNTHPTVKNTELMRYLTRLVTPKGGVCLDPFMGSGSTGKACVLEGFRFIGIDTEPTYVEIAEGRIKHAHNSLDNGETEP
jgi:site-specific DNA-methyltransferase (adenine-specific)